jgi:hypothetical protein
VSQGFVLIGASGRSRTGTAVTPKDFKSFVSTNFTTKANSGKNSIELRQQDACNAFIPAILAPDSA